jgi:hypothetical protein
MTSRLPQPIRWVLKWPLLAVSLLIWALVIRPSELIGQLVKHFAKPS